MRLFLSSGRLGQNCEQTEKSLTAKVKALAYLLGNECNVSHDKIREYLSELTNGELQISKGMINRLTRAFSRKTESERKEIYVGLMSHPVMNTDFTNANVNGKSAQVLICASPFDGSVLLLTREHKGHAGVVSGFMISLKNESYKIFTPFIPVQKSRKSSFYEIFFKH